MSTPLQIVENKPKNPWIVIFFEKLTQKSGSYGPKRDPFWRHVPVPLYRGVPPRGYQVRILILGKTAVGNNSELYGYVISGKSSEHVALVLIWQNSPTSWQINRARYIISGKSRQLVLFPFWCTSYISLPFTNLVKYFLNLGNVKRIQPSSLSNAAKSTLCVYDRVTTWA